MKSLGKGVVTWSYEQYRSNAEKEYDEFWRALFRELIQNSNDAGSRQIHISLEKQIITVQDDGCGMDLDTIQNKLLVIGGTFKDGKAVGGLGKAKELLFFSQPKWIIASSEHCVKGVGGEFEIFKLDTPIKGTTVTLYQPEDADFEEIMDDARYVVDRCQISARITINGGRFQPQITKGKMVRDLEEMGHLYYTKTCLGKKIKDKYYVHVRVNGCWMFDKWVGQHDGRIILDIDSDRLSPVKGLTANRDAMRYPYNNQLDALVQELAVDKKSALKKRNPTINLIRGDGQVYTDPTRDEIKEMMEMLAAEVDLDVLAGMTENIDINADRIQAVLKHKGTKEFEMMVEKYIGIVNYDPDFIIYEDPDNSSWSPGRIRRFMLTQKASTIAQVWTETIKQICLDNNINTRFTAGFLFDNDAEAMRIVRDGREHYLINPRFVPPTGIQNKVQFMHFMRTTGLHEVTHRYEQYHDEDFMGKYHFLEKPTWDSHRIYSKIGKLR